MALARSRGVTQRVMGVDGDMFGAITADGSDTPTPVDQKGFTNLVWRLIARLTTKAGALLQGHIHKVAAVCGFLGGCVFAGALLYEWRQCRSWLSRYLLFRRSIRNQDDLKVALVDSRQSKVLANREYNYVERIAMEVVVRLGGRPSTAAGMHAAEILAYRMMKEDNHRIDHIERDFPFVMNLIISPTDREFDYRVFVEAREFRLTIGDRSLMTSLDHGAIKSWLAGNVYGDGGSALSGLLNRIVRQSVWPSDDSPAPQNTGFLEPGVEWGNAL